MSLPGDWHVPPYEINIMLSAAEVPQWAWGIKLHGINELWAKTRGKGVRVCVLDTGIDLTHPDFKGAISGTADFTRSPFGIRDNNGHGTHTAGTIGARQTGTGVVGVAPECDLIIGKVLGDSGSGSNAGVAAGIDWAVASKSDVISMSLGGGGADPMLKAAIDRAVKAGCFVIVAAGNSGPRANSVEYPGKWKDVCVTVGAVNKAGMIADFSSRGPEVQLCAPGVAVLSCWPGGGYASLDGTSMATPFVAGTVALLKAYCKALGVPLTGQAALDEMLDESAVPLVPGQEFSPDWGYGIVNPKKLLAVEPPPTGPAPVDPQPGGPVILGPYTDPANPDYFVSLHFQRKSAAQ